MTPLLLALAGVAAFGVLGCVLLWRLRRAHQTATLVPGDISVNEGSSPAVGDCARVSGLTLIEAEDLLDWLEHNGYQDRNVECEGEDGESFAVRFRVDPEHPFVRWSGMPHRAMIQLSRSAKARR